MPTYANLCSVWGKRLTFRFSGRDNVREKMSGGVRAGNVQGEMSYTRLDGLYLRTFIMFNWVCFSFFNISLNF